MPNAIKSFFYFTYCTSLVLFFSFLLKCVIHLVIGGVLDTKSQNSPEVVVVRREVGGILGIWVGWVNWVKGSKWGQFTSNLRGRWTIPVTTGGSQVSEVGIQRGDKRGQRGAKGEQGEMRHVCM